MFRVGKNLGLLFLVIFISIISIFPVTAQMTSDTKTVVFLGDSITQGTTGSAYIDKLPGQGEPWNSSQLNLINSGVNNDRARNFYEKPERVLARVITYKPEYVMIFLGANDLQFADSQAFQTHYHWLLDTILLLDENRTIEAIFLVQFSWLSQVSETTALEYLNVIGNISVTYNYPLVNLWDVTLDHPEYFVDAAHPNDQGAEVIAQQMHQAFGSLINFEEQSKLSPLSESQNSTNADFIGLELIIFALFSSGLYISLKHRNK